MVGGKPIWLSLRNERLSHPLEAHGSSCIRPCLMSFSHNVQSLVHSFVLYGPSLTPPVPNNNPILIAQWNPEAKILAVPSSEGSICLPALQVISLTWLLEKLLISSFPTTGSGNSFAFITSGLVFI